ncbi:hypothetical protein WJX79_008079 [Trebouxia sp. C0005]
MGLPRKGKAGSKSKSSKKTEGKTKEPKKPQTQLDANKEAQLQLLPQERVLNVKPCWETIPDEDRVELLSVDLNDLRLRAIDLADKAKKQAAFEAQEAAELNDGTTITVSLEPGLDEIFEEGTRRLLEKSTWKLWQWPPEEREFFDADSFRTYAEEQRIDPELRKLLPRDEGKPIEKPAELALRERMAELLQKVHATNRQLQDNMQTQQTRRVGRRDRSSSTDQVPDQIRDSNIELITIILEALEKEHEYLYNAVLYPVTHFVCEMLPEQMRESTRTELFFDDLEKLPSMEVSRICEWLTEKVDGFSSKTRAEPKEAEEEEEEEGIGDVDLFTLTEDRNKLVVNVKWLQHLQERLLGDDGHPRKVHEGEDPNRMGLVLEWVYGTIVSTAEKARDGAKRALGMQPPTVHQAHDQLLTALQDMLSWEARAKTAKELLNDMLKSRREAAELATQYDIRPDAGRAGIPRHALMAMDGQEDSFVNESAELPDHAIIALLKREHLLTRAKLNALYFEHITGERRLRSLKTQLRQGEPEFDRLKRELEEVKNQPRGLEGTFRTAAEMERHRAQLADAAIEEQLEVQTAFREHGARLQGIYDKRQRTEHEMVHREQEIKQLQGWAQTVLNLINKFEDGLKELGPLAAIEEAESRPASPDEDGFPPEEEVPSAAVATARALTSRARDLTAHRQGIAKLRQHFSKDVRRQLYGDEDDRKFFQWVQSQLKQTEKRLEDGRAVLHHLEAQLINVACDDPGAAIGAQLALPLLQERLDAKAQDFARQKAAQAEEDIIKMEEEKLEKERSERERKLKQKQKAKDKVRNEKEKLAAEKEAAEREARERTEEQQRQQEEQSTAAREAAAMKREELKRAEEELMEARRQELLSEEDGYWRQRMDQQQLVEKLKAEVAEQEELKGHSEDGTDDTTPSSATPADDASDISPVDIPHPKPSSVKDNESAAATSPMANGFHLPNESAATDSDGFRFQHERRPSAANGRAGVHNRFGPRIPDQQADDSFRQRPRGVNQRSGSRDRSDGMLNRGSSAEGHDRFPRQGGLPHRDGSTERSDQDRFGRRRFNRDMGRNRRMDRGHPSKEASRPLPATRQPSANSTVSASREPSAQATAAPHLTLHPASAETSHANGPVTPQSASHSPLAVPALMQAAQHAAAEAQGQGIQTGPPGQGRSMPQAHFQQPGSRSSSIGQKRPMPSQDPQDSLPHQLTSPQQQRGQPSLSGPPTMNHLPFQGQMHPNGMPHYMASSNGMPPNFSMPLNRALNGMPYSVMPNQRPSLMNHVPMMQANTTMTKPGPMHHQGSMPYEPNPYMPGLSPASSLGNAPSKGSSILRATALPFVPGGLPQPASPMAAQFTPAAQHPQALLQRGPRQLQSASVMASAAPFFPGSDIAGSRAFPSDAAQRPAEAVQGQLEPSSSAGHMAHPSMLEAPHESASNLHGAVPSFMASLLPQDVPSVASMFSRHQGSSSEPSIATPSTPHPHSALTLATSSASAATQDGVAEHSRSESAGSLNRDVGVSERRASHAAAGTSSSLPRDSSASSFTSAPHKQSIGSRCKIVKRHGLVYEDRHDGMRRLKLVRGLSNMFGQYNCFLNVIIQSLWHLPAFRTALLTLPSAGDNGKSPTANGASPRDAAVSVSPDELREALSDLEKGQSPVEFELSQMHDAAEVLGEVFNCLHRAQLGSAATGGLDPQLPQLVRVPTASSSGSLSALATHPDPTPRHHCASSIAQDVFGQKVQVPCPPDDLNSPVSKKARAEVGQWQQQQSRSTASQQRQQAQQHQQHQQQQAAAKRQSKDSGMVDMHQFWKYFHLVPAQAMRIAYDGLNRQGSFEAVLREADSAEALPKRSRQSGAAPLLDITLLNQPKVFTLALVWESAKVAEEAITTTVDALQDRVDLSNLLRGVSPQSNAYYVLKSIICYFGHHYQAYAFSEELEQWLLFDDTNIQLIGDWQDVKHMVRSSRLQPSVLFYERSST